MTPEALAGLHKRGFARARPWSAAEFAELLESPHVFLCPAPHGFALGRAVVDEAELLTIVTDPGHRREGLARTCLSQFEREARTRGATRAFLEVDAENHPAIALYETSGYTLVSRRPAYYDLRDGTRTDALIMSKQLEQSAPPDH
jgi:ribosomal-protein-alanine N-acetyltransferase